VPSRELTNRVASTPKRAANFRQPLCGTAVISSSAEPTRSRVPAGRLSALRSRSTIRLSPASCQRAWSWAISAMVRAFMIVT
jgi:hypothetical protein